MFPADTYTEHEAHALMGECLQHAIFSYRNGEVPVGCLFVNRLTKQIVVAASNKTNEDRNACRHAELIAYHAVVAEMREAGEWERLAPLVDVWVSCEPCVMCAAALKTVGITRCIFGCANARFGGCGSALAVSGLQSRDWRGPLEIYKGCREAEAIEILQLFYERGNAFAPDSKRKRPLKNE